MTLKKQKNKSLVSGIEIQPTPGMVNFSIYSSLLRTNFLCIIFETAMVLVYSFFSDFLKQNSTLFIYFGQIICKNICRQLKNMRRSSPSRNFCYFGLEPGLIPSTTLVIPFFHLLVYLNKFELTSLE